MVPKAPIVNVEIPPFKQVLLDLDTDSPGQFVAHVIKNLDDLTTEGIYRLSATKERIIECINQINNNQSPPWEIDLGECGGQDDKSVFLAALIKEFIKQLVAKRPIFTSDGIQIVKSLHETREEKVWNTEKLKELQSYLDDHAKTWKPILYKLLEHLGKVAENSDINCMTTKNLGIVFAPNVFQSDNPLEEAVLAKIRASYFATLIDLVASGEGTQIFCPHCPVIEATSLKQESNESDQSPQGAAKKRAQHRRHQKSKSAGKAPSDLNQQILSKQTRQDE